jgi:hypothetical protein
MTFALLVEDVVNRLNEPGKLCLTDASRADFFPSRFAALMPHVAVDVFLHSSSRLGAGLWASE